MSIFDQFRLDGRTLFITGGSRGLGREMALAIASAGADVILVGRDRESLTQTAGEIKHLGRKCWEIVADVGIPDDAGRACREALSLVPRIDILINNVGGRRINVSITEQTNAQWQQILDLNLMSTIICTRELSPPMISQKWGRIINIASISGMVANRNIGGRSYETSKAAVIQFTRAAAVDFAQHGVTVNAICPGGFMTEPNQRWARENPEVISSFREQIPMGDFGQPADLGPLAVYLASPASRYMTGALLVIDGGYTLL